MVDDVRGCRLLQQCKNVEELRESVKNVEEVGKSGRERNETRLRMRMRMRGREVR